MTAKVTEIVKESGHAEIGDPIAVIVGDFCTSA